LQWAISKIINDSDSEENTEISDTENFSDHLHFSGSSSSSSEKEISPQLEPTTGHQRMLRVKPNNEDLILN
jgi:hypothetical protein